MISVVIPLGPHEQAYKALLSQIAGHKSISEIILVSPNEPHLAYPSVSWVEFGGGRAKQMNKGALEAVSPYLWFLHADSLLEAGAIERLIAALQENTKALYYFDLEFMQGSPSFMRLNEIGVKIRSDYLGMPFGDQGFALSKDLFYEIGAYPEDDKPGEDHLFVWYARQRGVKLINIQAKIYTSSRKYKTSGWGKTTLLHVSLTFKQAFPEWVKLMKIKYFK